MLQLEGENFQPWANFLLDVDKLTVIIGPSNKGKSAIFRALKGILRNELPASYVRDKHDPLKLTLKYDGHTIEAERKRKNSAKYVIDGDPYTALNRKVPEVIEKMNFGEIVLGKTTIDPIFAPQNKAQFLIDSDTYKDGDINAILGAFASTEKLDKGKKEANLRIKQKNSEATTLAEEIRQAEERKDKLAKLVVTGDAVAAAVTELERDIRSGEAKLGWTLLAAQHRQRVLPLRQIAQSLMLPDVEEAETLYQQLRYMDVAVQSLRRSQSLSKISTALSDATDDWSDVVLLYKQVRGLSNLLELLAHKDDTLTRLRDGLNTVLTQVRENIEDASDYSDSITYAETAKGLLLTVGTKRTSLEEIAAEVSAAQDELNDLRHEMVEAEMAAKQAAEAKKLCPKCGKSMEHVCG